MADDVQRKVDDFVEKYPLNFTLDHHRAEELSTRDPVGKNILYELNDALDRYIVFRKVTPSPPPGMAIHCALLINRAFTYCVIKEKTNFQTEQRI